MILPSQYFFLLGHSRMMHRIHLLVSPFKMEMIVGPQLWKVMGRLRPMTANHKGPIGALLQAAKERKISQIRDHWMCLVTDARFFLSLYQPSRNKENGSSMLPIRNLAKERRQAVLLSVCLTWIKLIVLKHWVMAGVLSFMWEVSSGVHGDAIRGWTISWESQPMS